MTGQGHRKMVWPWMVWSRRDMVAAALCFLFIVGVLWASVSRPYLMGLPSFGSTGFGPDWDCIHLPKAEPVCVKRVPHKPTP